MSSVTSTTSIRRWRTIGPRFVGMLAFILLLAGVGGLAAAARQTVWLPGQAASPAAIESKYGVRLMHIAVLADGGLIDFRFQVLDPDKALALFEIESRPLLFVEADGQKIDSLYHPPHGHRLWVGQSKYFIYNNHRGAIQSGTAVSVVFGDLRLEHVIAK